MDTTADLPNLELTPELFLDHATAIFGPTFTGKTTTVKNIMIVLKDVIPQVIVVSPSEPSNHAYEEVVPKQLIHYKFTDPDNKSREDCEKFLETVWMRQEFMTGIYAAANNFKYLRKLYHKIESKKASDTKINSAQKKRRAAHETILKSNLSDGLKADRIKKINDRFKSFLAKIYKDAIRSNAEALEMQDISKEESIIIKHIDFNPRLLLILDDCAQVLKEYAKTEILKNFLYRGRHVLVTTLFVFQDDTDFPPNLRKNIFLSFFSEEKVCRAFFNRGTNNFSREDKSFVNSIAPRIFSKKYVNFVYRREDPTLRYYYKYETYLPTPFKFGSDEVWQLCRHIDAKSLSFDKTNPYYRSFLGDERD
jgi:hypothetical protein